MRSLEFERSDFASIDSFSSLLSHAEGLTYLSLIGVSTHGLLKPLAHEDMEHGAVGKEQGVRSNHQRRHLLDLRLKSMDNSVFVDWLLGPQSPLEVSHIQTLHISFYGQSDAHVVNKLLYTIGSSLRHFTLNVPNLWSG